MMWKEAPEIQGRINEESLATVWGHHWLMSKRARSVHILSLEQASN